MNQLSNDILAKLLATENITVTRSRVPTASFDIKNRVLSLPQWKNLSMNVEEMLILHEVGHALYTTMSGYGVVHEEKKYLQGYANIIEDVRIEKRMKERYPGSRKSFNAGYTELNDKDFFGVKDQDLSELLLIDRINLYYKVGYNAGIPFTAEEYVFVQKADKTVTEEDVINLAQEIFDYSKAQKEEEVDISQPKRKLVISTSTGDSNGDEYDDIDLDDYDEIEVNIDPETMKNFNNALDKHTDRLSRTFYFEPSFEVESTKSPIVPYKTVITEMIDRYDDTGMALVHQKASVFKTESSNIVNYLVKEFEMRKSASAYKRAKISKLGQLDSRKLFAYRLKDDIFKQITTVQEGKNHGMIFLLDWSGSMGNYMEETVEQVINLAMFCQKIRIPYKVFAFTDGYYEDASYREAEKSVTNQNGLDDGRRFHLLELFTQNMNTRDFNKMIELLLDKPWYRRSKYGLNGTPLNSSLIFMADYIGKFIRENDVEKMNLITLTDGESNSLCRYNYSNTDLTKIADGPTYISEDGVAQRVNATSILRDPVTRKEYRLTDSAADQTAVLLQLLKDRYRLRSIGFYISTNNIRHHERFLKHNMNSGTKTSDNYALAVAIHEKVRRDKAAVVKTIPGRDELYVIASNNKIVDDDLDDVKQDMSAAQISKHLTKMFNSRKSSRVVLNSFIGQVA